MARRPKPSGRSNKGPWSPDHIRRALEADGWVVVDKDNHTQLKHPTRSGKITVDKNWKNGVRAKDDVFAYMAAQGGYTKRQLIQLCNSV